jgi:CheY-like chemotaxis protein
MRLNGGDGETVASASEMMERQVAQLIRLVDDLLDVSRVSRGKIELRRERIDLVSIVRHAVEAAASQMQCMQQELKVNLPSAPIYLYADSTRLAQVVGNLLSNACKFTGKQGRIELAVERAGAQAVLRVRDTGIGIAADLLPRVFDMFTQADTALERNQGGLGIGLTLVKSLVEMHEGTVEAKSGGIGQGSEFIVRLPVMQDADQLPSPPVAREPMPATNKRILVVDDNQDSAASLSMLLELTGHETHIAHDGKTAVDMAAKIRPDVVLLDIGLPKLNGYEACRRMRDEPWGKSMLIVALTGWGQDSDREKSRQAGFDRHLTKPVDHATLTKLLAEPAATA